MEKYCITAANHENPNNHVASMFEVWKRGTNKGKVVWNHQPAMSAKEIVILIEQGHQVVTGQIDSDSLNLGAPVEVELRIAKNETEYPISGMPTFEP